MIMNRLMISMLHIDDMIFPPTVCFFCGDSIVRFEGHGSTSLSTHHINWDHDDDSPENVAFAHTKCHHIYHGHFKGRNMKYRHIKDFISKAKAKAKIIPSTYKVNPDANVFPDGFKWRFGQGN